jgi:hypothetical protein
MYSRHAGGFLASSRFSQMRRASMLQLPQLGLHPLDAALGDLTPMMGSHLASSPESARELAGDTSAATRFALARSLPGGTRSSSVVLLRSRPTAGASLLDHVER